MLTAAAELASSIDASLEMADIMEEMRFYSKHRGIARIVNGILKIHMSKRAKLYLMIVAILIVGAGVSVVMDRFPHLLVLTIGIAIGLMIGAIFWMFFGAKEPNHNGQ